MSAGSPYASLEAELRRLRAALGRDLEGVAGLAAVEERRAEIDGLVDDLDRQIGRSERTAVITLVGATGAGKSTLLNALAGRRIAVEGVDRPTTSEPVVFAPADADLSGLFDGSLAEDAVRVEHYTPSPEGPWTAQILIDAPDWNSVAARHREIVRALAERSDVLLVVLHRQAVVEEASVSFLGEFADRRRLLFVLNRADELTPEGRERLSAQVRRLAQEVLGVEEPVVVVTSARAAQGSFAAVAESELGRRIRALVEEGAISGVRRLNALGSAARLAAIFAEVGEVVRPALDGLGASVGAGAAAVGSGAAAELADGLRLRRPDLEAILWTETARRWDGPGGWMLRAGSLASLGIGAGAFLARRSTLVGAGTAAAGVAVDQTRKLVARRRVAARAGGLEGGGLAAEVAEHLSAARVRAAELRGDPGAYDVPGEEDLRVELEEAAEESWRRLADRELPRAAERSWLRYFRLALDLPVYGLAAYVVWNVAAGFFDGRYAGLDFLVSAAILLVAYLFPLRWLVRRFLALRVGRLLREATRRLEERVAHAIEAMVAAVEGRAAEERAALDRLGRLDGEWRDRLRAASRRAARAPAR